MPSSRTMRPVQFIAGCLQTPDSLTVQGETRRPIGTKEGAGPDRCRRRIKKGGPARTERRWQIQVNLHSERSIYKAGVVTVELFNTLTLQHAGSFSSPSRAGAGFGQRSRGSHLEMC